MRIVVLLQALLLAGCGPLMFPMVSRLPPQEQKRVDSAWDAMLSPVDRLDRQTLLDCIVFMQLHQTGVDRLTMRSTKQTAAGEVEMTVDFDRDRPDKDQFTFRLSRPWRGTQRFEQWSAREMFDQFADPNSTSATTQPSDEQREAELERRMERFHAATQPASK